MRLSWKREPAVTGLARVGAAPRGSKLHDGEKTYATTCPNDGGWYWVAGWDSDIPPYNSCRRPVETEGEAKKQAKEYVLKHLKGGGV